MDIVHSYRDGLREGVAFLLVDDRRRVLLEWRPDEEGNHTDVFFPSGSIDRKDHGHDGIDYCEVALRREIGEEFRGGVSVERIRCLGESNPRDRADLLCLLGRGLVGRPGRVDLGGRRAARPAGVDVDRRREGHHPVGHRGADGGDAAGGDAT